MIENPRKKIKKKTPKKAPSKRVARNEEFDEAFNDILGEIKQRYIENAEENEVLVDSAIRMSIGNVKDLPSRRPIIDAYHYATHVFLGYMQGELSPDKAKDAAVLSQYIRFYMLVADLYNKEIDDDYAFSDVADAFEDTLGTLNAKQQAVPRSLYAGYVKAVARKFENINIAELLGDNFSDKNDIKYFMGIAIASMFVGVTRSPSFHLASDNALIRIAGDAFRALGLVSLEISAEEREAIISSGLVKVAYKNRFGKYVDLGDIRIAPSIAEPTIINLEDFIDEEKEAEIARKIEEEKAAREEEAREAARIAEEEAKAAEEAALAAAREAEEARLEAERVRALEQAEREATLAAARIEEAKEEALNVIEEMTILAYEDRKPSWADFREFVDAGTLTKQAVKDKINATWELRPVKEQRARAELSNLVSNVTQPVPTAIEAKAATNTELSLVALQDAIDLICGVKPVASESSDSQVELRVSWAAEKAMEPWGYSFTALYEPSGLAGTMDYDSFENKVREELIKYDALDATLARQQEIANLSAEKYTIRNCRAWVVLYLLNNIRDMDTAKKFGFMSYVDLMPAMTYNEEREANARGRVPTELNERLKRIVDTRWEAALNTLSKYESGDTKKTYSADLIEEYTEIRKKVYAYLNSNILRSYQGSENQLFIMPDDVAHLKSYYTKDARGRNPVYITDDEFTFDSYRSSFGTYSAVGFLHFNRMLDEAKESQAEGVLFTRALSYCGPKARTTPYYKGKSTLVRKKSAPVVADKSLLGVEIWKYITYKKADWLSYISEEAVESFVAEDEKLFDYGIIRGPFGMGLSSAKRLTVPQQKILRELLPELKEKYAKIKKKVVTESRRKVGELTEARAKMVDVLLDYYSPEELIERNPTFMYKGDEVPLLARPKDKPVDFDWFYRFVNAQLGPDGRSKVSKIKRKRPTALYLDDERLSALRETLAIYSGEVAESIGAYRDFISQSSIKAAVAVNPQYYDLANTMQAIINSADGALAYRQALPDWINELESTMRSVQGLSQENLNNRIAMVIKAYAINVTKYPRGLSYSRIQAMQDTAQAMRLSIEFVKIVTRGLHSKIGAADLDVRTPRPVVYRGRGNPYLDNDIIFSLYFNDGISIDNLAAIYDVEEEDIYDILAS